MSSREFVALGTSSQTPTRERSHNSYFLNWDGTGLLFDPGEATQRQMTFAGIPATAIHHICITHFHGDHCLGLAGVVQRLSLEACAHPVHVYFPAGGQVYFDHLCNSAIYVPQAELVCHPIPEDLAGVGEIAGLGENTLYAARLDHSVPTFGFRLEEAEGRRFLPDKLEALGISGPRVGDLRRVGSIDTGARIVHLDEVAVPRPGNVFAFVMDTAPCPNATALARDADLVVMEATYTNEHQELAARFKHSTAEDAARTAVEAGARQLALSHFSQRYSDTATHVEEARRIFPRVVALRDLDRITVHRRR